MGTLYKEYDHNIVNYMADAPPVPDLIRVMFQGYIIQLLSALFATSGALLHAFYEFGSFETGINTGIFIWLLVYLDKRKQIYHCLCLLACHLFFGATIGPMVNYFVDIEQRLIISFFGGYALCLCFHLFAICTRNMRVIHTINFFNIPLLMFSLVFAYHIISHGSFFDIDIPVNIHIVILFLVSVAIIWYVGYWIYNTKTWDWRFVIVFHLACLNNLAFSFDYDFWDLAVIYVSVVFVFLHFKLHDFDCRCFVIDSGRIDRPATNILAFYADFVGRSSYLLIHLGQILVDCILKRICIEEWGLRLTFCVEALKAGCALLYLVKAFIVRAILTSIIVVSLGILFFMFLATKVQGRTQ